MGKINKKLVLSVIIVAVMLILPISSFAVNPTDAVATSSVDISTVSKIGGSIVRVVSAVASVVAVLVLVILGIKYMMGSAEEKAEYKKTLIPYIVGAILVFGASSIANGIYTVSTNLTDEINK